MKDQVNNFASKGLSAGYVSENFSHEMKGPTYKGVKKKTKNLELLMGGF